MTNAGWDVVRTSTALGDIHVVPAADAVEHSLTRQCLCRPFVEQTALRSLIVHHSADGREYFEPDHDEDNARESVS